MKTAKNYIIRIFKKEPVLSIASVCAVLSMFVVHPSAEYLQYIEWKTLICLFCLMASIKGLEREGVLETVSKLALSRLRSARPLILFLVFGVFFASMLMTNDVALIVFVPIAISVLYMCRQTQWTAYVVVLQTIAANIGSSLTPIGNPQNLYIFSHYNMSIQNFIMTIIPYVLGGSICLAVCCFFVKNEPLAPIDVQGRSSLKKHRLTAYIMLFAMSVATVLGPIPYVPAAVIVIATAVIIDKKLLREIDYSLLLTFAVIFVFVGNLSHIPTIEALLQSLIGKNVVLASALSSQFISNVPAAILLSKFTDEFAMLLVGVNIGGLGTLIASMASVISYKLFANVYPKQNRRFLKIFTIYNTFFLLIMFVLYAFCS